MYILVYRYDIENLMEGIVLKLDFFTALEARFDAEILPAAPRY